MSTHPIKSPSGAPNEEGSHLIVFLLVAYCALVIDASLSPFSGWRSPVQPLFGFLTERWPRYLAGWEIPVNVAGYFPLGFLLSMRLLPRRRYSAIMMLATFCGFFLSLCLEWLQNFLPARIPSNLDLACNTLGALLGAGVGVWTERAFALRLRLPRLHAKLFVGGIYGDFGAILVLLWLFAQINPEIGFLGTSNLNALRVADGPAAYSVATYFWCDMVLTACNLFFLCAFLKMVTTDTRIGVLTMLFLCASSAVLKVIGGSYLLRWPEPWLWVTPSTLIGSGLGLALLLVWNRFGAAHAKWIGVLALITLQMTSFWMPENPYMAMMVNPISRGHLSNLNGATWWTAQAWPWLALLCILGVSLRTRPAGTFNRAPI